MPHCTVVKENNEICSNTYQLNTFFFFDPTSQSLEKTTICQYHSDEILKLLLEEIKFHQHKQSKIYSQIKTQKYNAKNFDIAFDMNSLYSELESNNDLVKRIRWQFCRWPICENRKFFYDELIYSGIVFSTRGRLRHIFYFHVKCWKQFKARCGLQQVIQTGQKSLDMMIK